MLRRISLALPLALLLGCGSAPPPSAEAPRPTSAAADAPPGSPTTAAPAAAPAASAASAGDKAAPPAPGAAQSVAADAPISTKITQDEILAQVNQNGGIFNKCYTLGAGASKSYRAKVTIKATVSPVGSVNVVEVINSTAKNPKVDACVAEGFKKLTFARPKGSGATVFTFPLSFDGIEQVP